MLFTASSCMKIFRTQFCKYLKNESNSRESNMFHQWKPRDIVAILCYAMLFTFGQLTEKTSICL